MGLTTLHRFYMFAKEKNKIILSIFFLLINCSKEKSTTNFKDVHVYTSLSDQYRIEEVLSSQLFDFKYYTPSPQKKYKPVMRDLSNFADGTLHSAVMLVALQDSQDSLGMKLANRLGNNSDDNLLLINDYLSENQLLFLIKADDPDALSLTLEMNKDWILSKLKENEFNKLMEYSFRGGINDSISQLCQENFNLDIKIQKDYQIIKESDNDEYLWIGRGYPYRWILLYEDIQSHYNSKESTYRRLDEKFSSILNINALPYEVQHELIRTKNDEIRKIYGVYGTTMDSNNITGGPYISYFFDIPETNKVLIASGFVNFPGKDKVFHIKELEYMLETAKIIKQ